MHHGMVMARARRGVPLDRDVTTVLQITEVLRCIQTPDTPVQGTPGLPRWAGPRWREAALYSDPICFFFQQHVRQKYMFQQYYVPAKRRIRTRYLLIPGIIMRWKFLQKVPMCAEPNFTSVHRVHWNYFET